jgi:1,4-dihydroxy-2-naphthoyl-CoA hydrolase
VSAEFVDAMNQMEAPTMLRDIGVRVVEASEEVLVAELEASPATRLPTGFFFGGALLAAADAVAGALTWYQQDPGPTLTPLTSMPQINVNIMRNSQGTHARLEARYLRRGRRVSVVETRAFDEEGRLLLLATSHHVPLN